MSSPWGGSRAIGSWAAEAEAEDLEQAATATATAKNSDLQSYPTLKDSITTKPKKKNKMTLGQFHTGGADSTRTEALTPNEMLHLPTGPKDRASDDYSGTRTGYSRGSDSSWGSSRSRGGFDDDSRRVSEYDLPPSRADESSNWGTGKMSTQPPSAYSGRTNRYDSLGAGHRADESESWNMGKKPVSRSSSYRSTNMDSGPWKKNEDIPSTRPRLVLDPRRGEAAAAQFVPVSSKASPFGAARPREEVLAEKGLDWKKMDLDMEVKSAQSNRSENNFGLPVKVNPFGDAKPRKMVLQDQELDQRVTESPETEEEKALKVELEALKKEVESVDGS